jgi:hypothetical protein
MLVTDVLALFWHEIAMEKMLIFLVLGVALFAAPGLLGSIRFLRANSIRSQAILADVALSTDTL